jgi:uncharacterized lipoprotein NlpE involved in copper resistance
MLKKLIILSLAIIFCLGCEKKKQATACGTGTCTATFASITVFFNDKKGLPIEVEAFSATNQRTKESVTPAKTTTSNFSEYVITDDSMISKIATAGDDILVTAINPKTGQTRNITYKITGGCNCHVEKIYGLETIPFE